MAYDTDCTIIIETISKQEYEVDLDITLPVARPVHDSDIGKLIKNRAYIRVTDKKCVMCDKIESFMII